MKYFLALLTLLYSNFAFSEYGLKLLSEKYAQGTQNDTRVVSNMPKVRTQDSFGICYASAAATIYDEANCSANNTADCSSVPDTQRASLLDISRFSKVVAEDEAEYADSYSDRGIKEGGWAPFAIHNSVFGVKSVASEACAPFNVAVANISSESQRSNLENEMWKNLKSQYEQHKKRTQPCADCDMATATAVSGTLSENFKIQRSNVDILKAFSESTYEKFLDKLLISDKCASDGPDRVKIAGKWNQKIFPEEGKSDYAKMVDKIKDVLLRKRPIAISFCTQTPLSRSIASQKACGEAQGNSTTGLHAVVIKGYRKSCSKAKPTDCREAIQIQNSWGESWQAQNDDGWVDAKEILGRTFYESGSLSWLEQKPVTN